MNKMDWKLHLFFGVLFGSIFAYFFDLPLSDYVLFLAISGFSSLLPDIDHPKSKISQIVFAMVYLLILSFSFYYSKNFLQSIILSIILISIFFLLYFTFKPSHRGITHKFWFSVLFSFFLYLVFGFFAIAFFLGYFSHILVDLLS